MKLSITGWLVVGVMGGALLVLLDWPVMGGITFCLFTFALVLHTAGTGGGGR